MPSTFVSMTLAVLIPMTSPEAFNRAPPLLPGLIGALVCSTVSVVPSLVVTSRLRALMIPSVVDWP